MSRTRQILRLASALAAGSALTLGAVLVGVACSSSGGTGEPANTPAETGSAMAQQAPRAVAPHFDPPASLGAARAADTAIPEKRRLTTPLATPPASGFAAGAIGSDLASWSERRAFDGAPPVIPHPADFGSGATSCVDCHLEGMRLGARVARPMSHPVLAACEQCHVEAAHSWLAAAPAPATSFVGLALPGKGERWAPGAPPTIPHTLWMRGNCLGCHGAYGFDELQTSHPERANCVQCHVPRQAVTE